MWTRVFAGISLQNTDFHFCHLPPASLSPVVLRNMKLWTAMKCTEEGQCSLHLSIKGTLHLHENVRGMEICSLSMNTQKSQCVNVKVSRNTHVKLTGKKVKIQFNCFEVSAGQQVYVTMRTIPNYCGVQLNQEYYVEDCRNSDVGTNIPNCFAGKLTYEVDRARQTILLNISDVAQSTGYYVRLCHQWFVCEDVGSVALIQTNDLVKSISLPFTQMLPCLCIEAWPAIPDARRMQMCPFKNNIEALWDNFIYNPITQTLTWEAACPIHVSVSLCELMKTNDQCIDLPNSSKTASEKVKYSRVDAHEKLCMKFTMKDGSWVRCPFAHGYSQAWTMKVSRMEEQIQASFTSNTEAQFSVLVCNGTESSSCDSAGIHQSISVGSLTTTSVNISGKTCGLNICIQGWRTDVDYSIPTYICDLPCAVSSQSHQHHGSSFNILSVIAMLAVLVSMAALLGYQLLSVLHRKRLERKGAEHIKRQRMKSIRSSH
ncbi:putative interleukin-17 receptor E-like isoform X2 [Eublepharis macularius]|uniref:Interleukin-17 receptor E-like isoform X2 n=1 Tax=Eublepharis macularius TaxID=481883 RepID=A0AA97JWK0_EUBMA|nr:putative interleukin-17 receptor E-like isoform X2 [Eublepharis macularius]